MNSITSSENFDILSLRHSNQFSQSLRGRVLVGRSNNNNDGKGNCDRSTFNATFREMFLDVTNNEGNNTSSKKNSIDEILKVSTDNLSKRLNPGWREKVLTIPILVRKTVLK